MVDNPHAWTKGTLIQNNAGIFDTSYWEGLGQDAPPTAKSAIVIATQVTESSVPSFIVTLMTPDGQMRNVMYEALSVTHIT